MPAPASRAPARRVLHIAGLVSEPVFSFVGPTLDALARAGYRQTLVLFDTPGARRLTRGLQDLVSLHPIAEQGSAWRNWRALAQCVQSLCEDAERPFETVHLHGVLPWLLGTRLGTVLPPDAATYFSPHGSRALRLIAPLRGPIGLLTARAGRSGRLKVIVNSRSEAGLLRTSGVNPMVVESALHSAFFSVPRKEARRTLVVSGSLFEDRRAVELFTRLAVVLGAAELGCSFNWVGTLGDASRTRLNAAGVGCFENTADDELASRLAAGWLFIAAGGAREFPLMLAAAMAVGLPSLVADEAKHRDLVRHGETGFIYRSHEEALSLLSLLIDDGALRRRLGQAARVEAAARFAGAQLQQAIQSAYARTAPEPSRAHTPMPSTKGSP